MRILPLLKVISDENRMRIILSLSQGEKCVCEIFKELKLPQNLTSHHLGILRDAGIIRSRKAGKWVHYSLNALAMSSLAGFFSSFLPNDHDDKSPRHGLSRLSQAYGKCKIGNKKSKA